MRIVTAHITFTPGWRGGIPIREPRVTEKMDVSDDRT